MQRLEDVFIGLGFQVAEGPEVETDFYNFEALNMPRTHPARSEFDTMFIEPFSSEHEANTVLLRTHTSPVQIRVMQSWEPPIYAIMPGRVFRRDTPDATHMPVFHQIEGLVIDRDITFASSQADCDLHFSRSPNHLRSLISNDLTATGSNSVAAEWCTPTCCARAA
jgi:phenylalanyl-tRNA synthetase alpha chain